MESVKYTTILRNTLNHAKLIALLDVQYVEPSIHSVVSNIFIISKWRHHAGIVRTCNARTLRMLTLRKLLWHVNASFCCSLDGTECGPTCCGSTMDVGGDKEDCSTSASCLRAGVRSPAAMLQKVTVDGLLDFGPCSS